MSSPSFADDAREFGDVTAAVLARMRAGTTRACDAELVRAALRQPVRTRPRPSRWWGGRTLKDLLERGARPASRGALVILDGGKAHG